MLSPLQTRFELTQKIHKRLAELAESTGIKVGFLNKSQNFWYEAFDCNGKITQIIYNTKLDNPIFEKLYFKPICPAIESLEVLRILNAFKEETLDGLSLIGYYERWFNGSKSLFKTDPIQVLSELLTILESIK